MANFSVEWLSQSYYITQRKTEEMTPKKDAALYSKVHSEIVELTKESRSQYSPNSKFTDKTFGFLMSWELCVDIDMDCVHSTLCSSFSSRYLWLHFGVREWGGRRQRGGSNAAAKDEDQVYLRANQQTGEYVQQAQIPGSHAEEEACWEAQPLWNSGMFELVLTKDHSKMRNGSFLFFF